MHVLSFNLRVNVKQDGIHAWPYRKKEALQFIKEGLFDVIGLQEVTPDMYQDLKSLLNDYYFIHEPRDCYGESAPLLIKKGLFEVIEEGTFWLTETPYKESKLENSAFPRTASYAVLRTNNDEFYAVFNTHLDYQDGITIYHQAEYLYHMMHHIKDKYQASLILTGDFNQHPKDLAIAFLSSYLKSCYKTINQDLLTFHGFTDETKGLPIDYIFLSHDLNFVDFKIHHHSKDVYLSDHYPISLKVKK